MGLYDYQASGLNNIITGFRQGYNSIVYVLPTGGGKTHMFVALTEYLVKKNNPTLILVHRSELSDQTTTNFNSNDVFNIDRNTKSIDKNKNIYVGMVESVNNRLAKDPNCLDFIKFIIIDECHLMDFNKVRNKLKKVRTLGFTATPHTVKTIKFDEGGVKKSKKVTLKHYFEHMILGPQPSELIKRGYLVEDDSFVLAPPNISDLVESRTAIDGFTNKSLTSVYANKAALKLLLETYKKYGSGKKTIIFNANTTVNREVEKIFIENGIYCRNFDSVNNKESERTEVVGWFKKSKWGLLINTNVFTTGFDDPEVECIIINRATMSLSLWKQMTGRGSRACKYINKKKFICIDLGGNIARHGRWGMDIDWLSLFNKDYNVRKLTYDLESVWFCDKCGYINNSISLECKGCGNPKDENNKPKNLKGKDGKIVKISKPYIPNGQEIIKYCIDNNLKSTTTAFKILDTHIMSMIISSGLNKFEYTNNKDKIDKRLYGIYNICYLAINKARYTHGFAGAPRKRDTAFKSLKRKIHKFYDS